MLQRLKTLPSDGRISLAEKERHVARSHVMHALLWNDGIATMNGMQHDMEEVREYVKVRKAMMAITYKRVTFQRKDDEDDDPGYMLKNRLSLQMSHI